MRALSLTGLVFGPDGSLIRQESKGPPTVEHWSACFLVYATAMIMLNAADPPHLFAYGQYIERQARQFGVGCWAIIYQAEARFRREGIERLRRSQSDALDEALLAQGTTPFRPTRPWDRCFQLSIEQYAYWHTNIEIPAMLVLSKSRNSAVFLDGDAEAASSSLVHVATRYAPNQELSLPAASAPSRVARGPPDRVAPTPKKPKTTHSLGSDGNFNANRSGTGLCPLFNLGTCTKVLVNGWCGTNRHQCSKCLSPDHPATSCSATPAMNLRAKVKGKGKGRGKNKV
jgi:hypothetical protein